MLYPIRDILKLSWLLVQVSSIQPTFTGYLSRGFALKLSFIQDLNSHWECQSCWEYKVLMGSRNRFADRKHFYVTCLVNCLKISTEESDLISKALVICLISILHSNTQFLTSVHNTTFFLFKHLALHLYITFKYQYLLCLPHVML